LQVSQSSVSVELTIDYASGEHRAIPSPPSSAIIDNGIEDTIDIEKLNQVGKELVLEKTTGKVEWVEGRSFGRTSKVVYRAIAFKSGSKKTGQVVFFARNS
jgi:hypothetical protein